MVLVYFTSVEAPANIRLNLGDGPDSTDHTTEIACNSRCQIGAAPHRDSPAKAKATVVEKAPEPSTKASEKTRQSAYEKLALTKLNIEEPAPKETTPTPKPEREPEKEPEHRVKAGAANVSVLPSPARKAPTPSEKLRRGKFLSRRSPSPARPRTSRS
jgi:hypothetical protein